MVSTRLEQDDLRKDDQKLLQVSKLQGVELFETEVQTHRRVEDLK